MNTSNSRLLYTGRHVSIRGTPCRIGSAMISTIVLIMLELFVTNMLRHEIAFYPHYLHN